MVNYKRWFTAGRRDWPITRELIFDFGLYDFNFSVCQINRGIQCQSSGGGGQICLLTSLIASPARARRAVASAGGDTPHRTERTPDATPQRVERIESSGNQ